MMTPRERVKRTLSFEEPDRVPIDLGTSNSTTLTLGAFERLKDYLGFPDANGQIISRMFQTIKVDERILKMLEVDLRSVFFRPGQNSWSMISEDTFENEWGIRLRRPKGGLYYDIVHYPLKDLQIDELERYPWPNPLDPARVNGVDIEARDLFEHTDYALMGPGMEGSIFEMSWYLRGFDQFLMDLVIDKPFAHRLLRIVTDYRKALFGEYLKKAGRYLDVFSYGDDIAMQTNPLMSLETYREMIKPYQKELFAFVKERTDAKLFYHTCGSVVNYLDDLIEIGVDIINPVQVSAHNMDTIQLKERFGRHLVFWGAIDTQKVLPFGTEQEVEEEVKRRIRDLAIGGGYVLTAVHSVQPDVPPCNLMRMFEAAKKFGVYPINIP
jgi:uroporphyrinogen decarboxylase